MKPYKEMTREELMQEKAALEARYKEFQDKGMKLDMSRGKPSKAQLDLSNGMMDVLNSGSDMMCAAGVDCRNYGIMDGIPEARHLLADMSEVPEKNILIYGNSSLNVMFDTVARAMTMGICGHTPWGRLDKVKFLCPVSGLYLRIRRSRVSGACRSIRTRLVFPIQMRLSVVLQS